MRLKSQVDIWHLLKVGVVFRFTAMEVTAT
jgi:hypothetical protein